MTEPYIFRKQSCRVCESKKLKSVINLGSTPLANAFLSKENLDSDEKYYPLEVNFCQNCSFLQLAHVVSSELLFSDYVYVSSTSQVFVKHFEDFAVNAAKKFDFKKDDLIVDIGSNDGILLKPFKKAGFKVLGIEPAKKIAEHAKKQGIETLPEFINVNLGKKISKKYGKAKMVTATNVFAHIDDLDEVMKSIKEFIDKDGVFMIEVAYLNDFIEKNYFDLVYHEHMSYWRVETFVRFFERQGMKAIDAQYVPVHGGSIRIFAADKKSKRAVNKSVNEFVKKERKLNLNKEKTFTDYSRNIEKNKILLLNLLHKTKSEGKKIVGYGAPAKGNTLLNYFGIGAEYLDCIVDDSSWKQGLFSPGKRIPVKSSAELRRNKADYLLILAWNFAPSIMEKNKEFKKKGGKFIIPAPKPKII